MDELRAYSKEDFGDLAGILARSGYRFLSWAELDRSNNIIYVVKLNPVLEQPKPETPKQILNEELENENGSQE